MGSKRAPGQRDSNVATVINPYLALQGTCRQAMEFYHSILGGQLSLNTFGESGMKDVAGIDPDGIMHAMLVTAAGQVIMASDTMGMEHQPGDTVAVSLSGDDASIPEAFEALAAGGQVIVPFEQQMWGDAYGQVRDRFGVLWHLNQTGAGA